MDRNGNRAYFGNTVFYDPAGAMLGKAGVVRGSRVYTGEIFLHS